MRQRLLVLLIALLVWPAIVVAQSAPKTFKVAVVGGIVEPLPFAAPTFLADNQAAVQVAADITQVLKDDLVNTGLFRAIPEDAFISTISSFNAQPAYADWKAINAQALLVGSASINGDNQLVLKFRLWDVFAQAPLGDGLQFAGSVNSWRRMAHKVADAVYTRLTGEDGYFDSRVVFVSESGPKDQRIKRLAVMDQDGANARFLTDGGSIVLAPRFSPNSREVLFTSYQSGTPQVNLMNVDSGSVRSLGGLEGMSFAPRFSPDGGRVVLSQSQGGNTDIYVLELSSGTRTRLTNNPGIDTAPSFSPDGSQIVFESDRGGSQQIYVMPAGGGEAKRISFGKGRYGTPVWSPRGDMVAFTKLSGGRFHIGVMRLDGSQERLLTASFLDEGPTWAPNGRVLMFFRESRGANGAPQLFTVDVSGRNLRRVPTPENASDPAWSGLLQ